jgi:hypothetical protein
VATEKPVAELTITKTPNGCHRYELFMDGERIWLTHARATVVEREGAKGRMRRWLAANPHEVQRVGVIPPVTASPLDAQEIAFWREFEHVLGGRLWSRVEQLIGKRRPPGTLKEWSDAWTDLDTAMRKRTSTESAA